MSAQNNPAFLPGLRQGGVVIARVPCSVATGGSTALGLQALYPAARFVCTDVLLEDPTVNMSGGVFTVTNGTTVVTTISIPGTSGFSGAGRFVHVTPGLLRDGATYGDLAVAATGTIDVANAVYLGVADLTFNVTTQPTAGAGTVSVTLMGYLE